MENKKKVTKNPDVTSETFRLNRNNEGDLQIIELLEKSNNKSGLIKDALGMYKVMIEQFGYNSPFIVNTSTDWTRVLTQLDPSNMIGRPGQVVKEEVKQELREYIEPARPVAQPVREELPEEIYEEDDEDDDDDFMGNNGNAII